jgi:hypothetical protein
MALASTITQQGNMCARKKAAHSKLQPLRQLEQTGVTRVALQQAEHAESEPGSMSRAAGTVGHSQQQEEQ